MSKSAVRWPLAAASSWASEAENAISDLTPRIAVAGSIRRKRPDVGDIDLVLLENLSANPWQQNAIAARLAMLGYAQIKAGERIQSFTRERAASLDLYYATHETWGITMVIRTGSAAHNIRLATRGAHLLPARRLAVSRGILDTAGHVVAGADESGVFEALDLPYVDAERREAPDLEHLVRPEE